MSSELNLTPGMRLLATASGWKYTVRKVGEDTVISEGPHGVLAVDRGELEQHINRGLVEILEWR